jgi:hypothetical protein
MRVLPLLALAALAAACAAAAAPDKLRAVVSPTPSVLTTRAWTPTIALRQDGQPASARLLLSIRSGAARRSFRPRPSGRGSYRVRAVFPSDGRWRWALTAGRRTLARGAISVSTRIAFELPYDVAEASDGTILFPDGARVLALDPATGRVRVHRSIGSGELVCMERLADATLFACDLPGNRIVRISPSGEVESVATVDAPADLVADPVGSTLWVASIGPDVGVLQVDVASGRVEPFAPQVENPHGIDRAPSGTFYVHDGHAVSRIDGATRAVTHFADVDAIKLLVAPDGTVYGIEGNPSGGRVVRMTPDGSVIAVAGTGSLGPHRDGPALELGILPSAVRFARDGSLLVSQVQPVPAIRRLDPATGRLTTLARGR